VSSYGAAAVSGAIKQCGSRPRLCAVSTGWIMPRHESSYGCCLLTTAPKPPPRHHKDRGAGLFNQGRFPKRRSKSPSARCYENKACHASNAYPPQWHHALYAMISLEIVQVICHVTAIPEDHFLTAEYMMQIGAAVVGRRCTCRLCVQRARVRQTPWRGILDIPQHRDG